MFLYCSCWVSSTLEACGKISNVFLKSSLWGICSEKPQRLSFNEAFRDAGWVTRMKIRVLKGLFRFEICSPIKYRFFEESVTFVHYVSSPFLIFQPWIWLWDESCLPLREILLFCLCFMSHIVMMSSIYLFQKMGAVLLCLSISRSILAMKILANATAIFVLIAVLWDWRKYFPLNWNDFSCRIRLSISLKYLVGMGGFPW